MVLSCIQCIFVWRLAQEKWFDLVLSLCEYLAWNTSIRQDVHIHICGDWPLRKSLEEKMSLWSFVSYHGYMQKEDVMNLWKTCHLTLMPSRFLETFGLSALDSLSVWVPVLCPAKWGLAQFALPSMCLDDHLVKDIFLQQVSDCIFSYTTALQKEMFKKCKNIVKKYLVSTWLQQFKDLSWLKPWAHILMVSDYVISVWGIETYMYAVCDVLQTAWYTISFYGCEDPHVAQQRKKYLRKSLCNNEAYTWIGIHLEQEPDLVWWHSVHRWLGVRALQHMQNIACSQWMMYHDVWLLHPFPSCVFEEEQLVCSSTFWWYIQEWFRCRWFLGMPWVILKWFLSWCIKKRLMFCDKHLVPSSFLKKHIHHVPVSHVHVFPHFVSQ